MRTPIVWRVAAGLASLSLLLACSSEDRATDQALPSVLEDDAITIASFNFAESELLAQLYGQALEAQGYDVDLELHAGQREFVLPALQAGLVEFVPEYAGTTLQFLSMGQTIPSADVSTTHDALVELLVDRPFRAMEPAQAQTSNVFVVSRATAARFQLLKISDLQTVAEQMTFGGPPECADRPFCLMGLEEIYGTHTTVQTGPRQAPSRASLHASRRRGAHNRSNDARPTTRVPTRPGGRPSSSWRCVVVAGRGEDFDAWQGEDGRRGRPERRVHQRCGIQ